jgi:ribosomal protein S18 acetylase RimI-like enzyme
MKFVKEVDGVKIIVEETNKNLFNLFEREGFKEVKEKPKLDK